MQWRQSLHLPAAHGGRLLGDALPLPEVPRQRSRISEQDMQLGGGGGGDGRGIHGHHPGACSTLHRDLRMVPRLMSV